MWNKSAYIWPSSVDVGSQLTHWNSYMALRCLLILVMLATLMAVYDYWIKVKIISLLENICNKPILKWCANFEAYILKSLN
jgi:hypothetical protein